MMSRPPNHAGRIALLLTHFVVLLGGCSDPEGVERSAPYFDLTAQPPETSKVSEDGVPSVQVDPERRTIWLPSGAQISYLLKLEPKSVLETRDIAFRGKGVRLEIDLEADELGVANLIALDGPRPGIAIPVELPDDPPVRLILRARTTNGEVGGGVMIRQPEIWSSREIEEAKVAAPGPGTILKDSKGLQPNVLIYMIDTLRRDRLGVYGYQRDISPNIDEFASQAIVFEHVVSQSSWTKASVASIFTGIWPPAHGATGWKHVLAEGLPTLAEVLLGAGYQTVAFSGNPNVVKAYGMDQGFKDFYRPLKRPSDKLNLMVFEWLDHRALDRPFFLYLHAMDPHAPYQPPEPFRERFAPDADQMPRWQPSWKWPIEALPYLSNLYDAEIAFNDASFGALAEELKKRGLFDNSLIVLISDHGEEFKEHGRWRHGATLYSESLEVPMIVKLPGQSKSQRVTAPVQQIDVMPTILDAVNIATPDTVEGQSLLRFEGSSENLDGETPPRIFSHLKLGNSPLIHSLIDGKWKLVRAQSELDVKIELFNWEEDRGEVENLAELNPIRTAWMEQVIDQKLAITDLPPPSEDAVIDPEIEEALEALGYLE
jgi:arylsulfatase A-like enzyme